MIHKTQYFTLRHSTHPACIKGPNPLFLLSDIRTHHPLCVSKSEIPCIPFPFQPYQQREWISSSSFTSKSFLNFIFSSLDCNSCPDFEEKQISDFDFVFPPPRKSGRGEVQPGPRIRKSIICWIPLPRISSSISLVQLARRVLTLSKYKLVRLPLAGFQPPICLDPHTKRALVAGLQVPRLTLVQKS